MRGSRSKPALQPEIAIQCLTINPARHMRLTPYVGSLSPGRFGDVVLLSDVGKLTIAEVWADGAQVSDGTRYTGPVPEIDGRNGRPRPSTSIARSSRRISRLPRSPVATP